MEEQEQLLKDIIEKTQKTIEESKDWHTKYDEQVDVMLRSKPLIDQFRKLTKEYDSIQFYLNEVQPDLITITAKCIGVDIATITIDKDKVQISTQQQEELNKEQFKCDIQLKDENLKSPQAKRFLEYFKQDLKLKTKPNKENQEAMLLHELSKTTAYNKLLIGAQPMKYGNLYYKIPVTIDSKTVDIINVLARTKVRKITLFEVMDESQDLDTILAQATAKAVVLTNILHGKQGERWYRLFEFHGTMPSHLTIKVCIAVPKSCKVKEFKPFELRCNIDCLDYRYLEFSNDQQMIKSITSNVNE